MKAETVSPLYISIGRTRSCGFDSSSSQWIIVSSISKIRVFLLISTLFLIKLTRFSSKSEKDVD